MKIQRYKTTLTILNGTSTVDSSPISTITGILRGVLLNIPTLTGSATTTIEIKDTDNFVIYSQTGIAHNSKSVNLFDSQNNPLQFPLSGSHVITLTVSASQTGDKNIDVVLLIEKQ